MTMPGGFEIAEGYITVRAKVDRDQIDRSANEAGAHAGKAAGASLTKNLASEVRRNGAAVVAIGSDVHKGIERGIKSRGSFLSAMFKNARRDAEKAGDDASKGLLGKMKGGLAVAGSGAIMAGLMPAMLSAGPILGSALALALTGALIAGIGVAGIGAGIALVAGDPKVKSAFDGLKKTVGDGLKDAAKPFIGPVVESIKIFKDTFTTILPSIQRMFTYLAPYVTVLAKGISDALIGVMPGLERVMVNSGPMITMIANGIAKIGAGTGAFLSGTVSVFNKLKALWGGGDTGPFTNLGPIIEKVKALGGTIKQVFGEIWTAIEKNKGSFTTFMNFAMGISNILWSAVGPVFKGIGTLISGVITVLGGLIEFFAGVFTGNWSRAGAGIRQIWDGLWKAVIGTLLHLKTALFNILSGLISGIKSPFVSLGNWFRSTWNSLWDGARNKVSSASNSIKSVFGSLRDSALSIFTTIGNKINAFKNGVINSFKLARDGIGAAWNGIKDKAKQPVNFVIDPVYKNLRNMWNSVANTVGLKKFALPPIAKFAKGGIAPGVGNRDTVPAMLTPGEGILTKQEMKKIGGPEGFAQLRKEIQFFKDGGIVGGIKDWVGGKLKSAGKAISGVVRGSLYPGAKALADRHIFPHINSMSFEGMSGMVRGGAAKLVNGALSWLKNDDSKNAAPAGSAGMGYKKMMEILRSKFPGLPLISGFRPGSRTLSGNRSYHSQGRAVDVKPSRAIAEFINSKYRNITKELITPYNDLNLHNGKNHRYTGAIWNQHNYAGGNAHTHWAADRGAVIPPKSTGTFTNATSSPEFAMTMDHLKDVVGAKNYYVTFNVHADDIDDVRKIKEALSGLGASFDAGYRKA